MAITQDGDLFAFGWSEYGQLGLGREVKEILEPHLVEDLKDQPVRSVCFRSFLFMLDPSARLKDEIVVTIIAFPSFLASSDGRRLEA